MYRTLKVLVTCGAVLTVGCGDSSRIPADLQNDLALASADADLQLAMRSTDQTAVVGAVERTTPPARAVAPSTSAPRPRRSPTPQVVAAVQPEYEIVEEPEVAAADQPVPESVEEAPAEVAATPRPRAIEPVYGGSGTGSRGTDWGTIIGIAGTVVLRGGDVGEDRCIPPGAGRGRVPIAINERIPRGTRGTGRVTMGDRSGRMGGSGSVVRSTPSRPRDVAARGPSSTSSQSRPRGVGSNAGTGGRGGSGTTMGSAEVQ